jgi:mannitol-1-phosphate/altronate dehydrogenase
MYLRKHLKISSSEMEINMKKALQYGAGNIGRGFIGQLLVNQAMRLSLSM